MAHAQHTPAPWRLNAGNETLVMGSNQRPIARAECGGTSGIGLAEAEANARLIAAAPDMLEALRAIATYMRGDLTADDFKSLGLKRGDMTGNVRRIAENVLTRIDGEAAP